MTTEQLIEMVHESNTRVTQLESKVHLLEKKVDELHNQRIMVEHIYLPSKLVQTIEDISTQEDKKIEDVIYDAIASFYQKKVDEKNNKTQGVQT